MGMIDKPAWQTRMYRRFDRGCGSMVVEQMGTKRVQQFTIGKIVDFLKPLQVGELYCDMILGRQRAQIPSRGLNEKSLFGFPKKV